MKRVIIQLLALMSVGLAAATWASGRIAPSESPAHPRTQPLEVHVPPPADPVGRAALVAPAATFTFGKFTSVQVNVDQDGNNILGDAANEPTVAVDPTDLSKMAIAWRQFDTVQDNFRQAGMAHSDDAGQSWTARTLDPGQFRSDPVLAASRDGVFYFSSLSTTTSVELFRSLDGGATWLGPVDAFGGDKQWITVDRTDGIGSGNIYQIWNFQFSCCPPADFTRSTDLGLTFQSPRSMPEPKLKWGTLDVGPDGTLYVAGSDINQTQHLFLSSSNAMNPNATPTFLPVRTISLGGQTISGAGPNPGGLLGQVWIATDHSQSPTHGNIYVLGSVDPPGPDPLDVMLIRSSDGGHSWSQPKRINDDAPSQTGWQWFGTMSVAPTGRIDVVWNDTRNDALVQYSELYYAASNDGGETWSTNVAITPPFSHHAGYPSQNKLGDYYHMFSSVGGAHLAYAATFEGEQNVYYVRIGGDCNSNGVEDDIDISTGYSQDCSGNEIPDECEPDCNANGEADSCDILAGASQDCSDNHVPDECEADCNANGESDLCDITAGTSLDANTNNVPDECEAVLHVRQFAHGKQTGLNWTDAYSSLQPALAHASTSKGVVAEIWVAGGTYTPSTGDQTASFHTHPGLELYGGFSGNESHRSHRNWLRNRTVLSGDITGNDPASGPLPADNSHHVVTCLGCGSAVLDGFIITQGKAEGAQQEVNGAGLYIDGGSPSIQNCVITRNEAESNGGGAYVSSAAPVFTNCAFTFNQAFEGAGIFAIRDSEIELRQCTIAHNDAAVVAGVGSDFNGSMLVSEGTVFWGNTDFSKFPEEGQIYGMTVDMNYSTVEGWSGLYGGTGNGGDNPLFQDPDGQDEAPGSPDDNFRLASISPLKNAGNPSSAGLPSRDLDAHPRVLCQRVDQGAYESAIADFDCNGSADLDDIGSLPECMEDYLEGCRAFDFDADGDVDLDDFSLMQAFWPG